MLHSAIFQLSRAERLVANTRSTHTRCTNGINITCDIKPFSRHYCLDITRTYILSELLPFELYNVAADIFAWSLHIWLRGSSTSSGRECKKTLPILSYVFIVLRPHGSRASGMFVFIVGCTVLVSDAFAFAVKILCHVVFVTRVTT